MTQYPIPQTCFSHSTNFDSIGFQEKSQKFPSKRSSVSRNKNPWASLFLWSEFSVDPKWRDKIHKKICWEEFRNSRYLLTSGYTLGMRNGAWSQTGIPPKSPNKRYHVILIGDEGLAFFGGVGARKRQHPKVTKAIWYKIPWKLTWIPKMMVWKR